MRKPLRITTPTHGMALAAQIIVALLGVLNLMGETNSNTITRVLGPVGFISWAATLIVSGLAAFGASAVAGHVSARRLPRILAVEAASDVGVLVSLAILVYAFTKGYGFEANTTVKTLALALAVGSGVRLVQIIVEVRRLYRALDCSLLADPPPLADPDN